MRVLLLSDAAELVDALRAELPALGYPIDWNDAPAPDGAGAAHGHDAWIVDARTPGGSGLAWALARRREGITTPAVVLIEHRLDADDVQALNVGPRDCLHTPVRAAAIADRFAAWRRRAEDPSADVVRSGDVTVDLELMTATRAGVPAGLTAREWELFEPLARRAGSVVPRAELAALLGRPDGARASNVVEVHLSAIRRKLGRDSIETIRGRGYRFKG